MELVMAQKKPAPKLAAKIPNFAANKATKATLSAVETSRSSAEHIVKMGTDSTREWVASSAEELQKAQEKLFAIGRETAANFSRSTESVSSPKVGARRVIAPGVADNFGTMPGVSTVNPSAVVTGTIMPRAR